MTQPNNHLFDFHRASLKATGDTIRWSLEGAERLRSHQLAAITEALASHAQATTMVNEAKDFEELVAVSAKLVNIQSRTMISYWSGLFQMASESQTEVTRRLQSQAEQIRENSRKILGISTAGQAPMLAALQPLVDAASSVYDLSARATEEATKFATGTWKTASAGTARRTGVNGHQKSA